MRMKGVLLVLFALLVVTLSASAGAAEQPVGEIRLSTLKGGEDIGPDYVRDVLVMLAKKARAEQGGQVSDWLALYRQASEIPGPTAAQIAAKALLRAAHIAQTQGTPLEQSWARMRGKPAKVSDWLALYRQASEIPGTVAEHIAAGALRAADEQALAPETSLAQKWERECFLCPEMVPEKRFLLLEQIISHSEANVYDLSGAITSLLGFVYKTETERVMEKQGGEVRFIDPIHAAHAISLVKRAAVRMLEVAEHKNVSAQWLGVYENFPSGVFNELSRPVNIHRRAFELAVRTASTFADACHIVQSSFLAQTDHLRQEARELMKKFGTQVQRWEAERKFPDCGV